MQALRDSHLSACAASLALAAVAAAACSGGERNSLRQRASDSRSIVYGRSIGDVHIGMARAQVERRYGKPTRESVLRDPFILPVGTPYHGEVLLRVRYRLHGGILEIEYVDRFAKTVRTTSDYYRTADGTGAGKQLPHEACFRLDAIGHVGPPGCKSSWRGFHFDGECLDAWLTPQRDKTMTLLYMHHGRRIESVRVGDVNVILPCF